MKPIKPPDYREPHRHAAAASGISNRTLLCADHQQSSSISRQRTTSMEKFQYSSSHTFQMASYISTSTSTSFSSAVSASYHRTSSSTAYTSTSTTSTALALQPGRNRERDEAKRRDYVEEKKTSDGKGKDERRIESGTKKISNRRGGDDTGPKEKERNLLKIKEREITLLKTKEKERRTGHGGDGAKEETKKERPRGYGKSIKETEAGKRKTGK